MRRRVIASFGIVITTFLAIVYWRVSGEDARDPIRSLVSATAALDTRPFDIRVSGGFPYKPLARVMRTSGASMVSRAGEWKLIAAAADAAAGAATDPRARHAFAISQMLLGRVAVAIETLEDALRKQTSNPSLLTDLAGAYFVRGRNAGDARDVMMAAECASRAWRLNPTHGEAAWNRAVIFETLGVPDVARAAWNDFLRLDSHSPWASEARERLAALEAPSLREQWERERQTLLNAAAAGDAERVTALVNGYPEQARTLVEEELLGEWAEKQSTDGGAATLRTATIIADAIAKVSHEMLTQRSCAVAGAARKPEVLEALVRGHATYRQARKLFKEGRHPDAQPLFAAAARDLALAGSPLAFRASGYDCAVKHYLGRNAEALADALATLHAVGSSAESYPTLVGQLRWTCGLAAMALGYLDDALQYHREALTAFERTQETSNLAGVAQVLSSDYRAIGDLDEAWSYQLRSLGLIASYATFERAQVVIGAAAVTALRDGYVHVADELQRVLLANARQSNQPIYICDALVRRSETLVTRGERGEARRLLAEALVAWNRIPETAVKSRLRADLEMARAGAAGDLAPGERIAELNTALEFVRKTNSRSRIARVLLLRARAHRGAGDPRAAADDLTAGIAEVEAQRENTTSAETRLTFLNAAAGLYEDAIRLHLDRGAIVEAFDLLERRRARWLLDRYDPAGSASVEPWRDLRRRIPPGVAVVSYSVSDRLHAWVATAEVVRHFDLGTPPHETVAAWREAIRSGGDAEERLGGAAYASLLEPLGDALRDARALVFVPDRFLNGLPFAALVDRRSGRRVIEDYPVGITASANVYVRSAARLETMAEGGPALIISNPVVPAGEGQPQTLAGAEAEATAVAALLRNASVVRGADATVDRFIASAPAASLIHVAAHTAINPQRPELSALLFASGSSGRSRLYARDIYSMHLPKTGAVVLAACESASGNGDLDAPLSLATAFNAAGVPVVVASLWPVDDNATSHFFRSVYQRLQGGMPLSGALREAQLDALRTRRIPLATWAAYQPYGGPPL